MSAGKYVVAEGPFSERWNWERWLSHQDAPEGAKVISSAAYGGQNDSAAFFGVRFPSAKAAATWIQEQCDKYGEEPENYPRFTTIRDMEDHLSDCSYRGMFG